MSVGAGGGDNMSINVSTNLNGTNAQIDISPTGTGHVHIKPTGVNSVEIAPTFVGEMDNVTIGATTPSTGSFTTVGIDTSGTDAQIAPNTGITGWDYSGLSKSIGAEESAPNGLFFSPDGLNMYVNGATGDDVNQYTLSTAWNVSTATYLQLFSTAAQDTAPVDIFFKPDGLSMFIMGQTNDTVFQYTLSSAWDISTASYASKSFSVTSQETTPTGLWFKSDGTVMYAIGTISDTVFQYNLGTAWDVSTASYASISFSVASQESSPSQLNLSADGTKMWIIGSSGDDINEYTLGTAWNVSTATFVNNFYVGFQETNPTGLFIDSTAANRVYIVGQTNDTVFQYNTATNSISAVTDVFNTTSNARVQGNLAVQGNANIDGTLAVLGVSSLGTTTVSGTLTSNSTTTLATLTSAQTVALGAGATVSGALKTLNIGTAGVSGSTTTINIGSAVSGATSTTTLNGLVIDSISAAVSAAGATQGTATGLVSNINNVTVVAVGAAGVRLPTAVAGMRILIRNSDSADVLSIYPATGGQINALGNNTASTLAAGLTVELVATTATQWYTF
jgi:sugar lactone lactonase YvrE